MRKLHVHIGHHFFGSGNIGDDLMLAGFLEAAGAAALDRVRLTCCTANDAGSQILRFPQVEWLPYLPASRLACIERCDAWLGLGDTPFQATGGQTWFLDHLCQEAQWCRQCGVPMFYLGVGVNERAAVEYPQTRILVTQAERIWMRDENSLDLLGPLAAPGKVTAHADLAHPALAAMHFPPPKPRTLAFVLNFEDPAQFRLDQLASLIRAADAGQVRWLAQEVRPLPGSETVLHRALPEDARARAPLLSPPYATATSARALLAGWVEVGALFTSRYHAALTGAWMGARVAIFPRSAKVAGAGRQLGLPAVATIDDASTILETVRDARPVDRRLLLDLAARARDACMDFLAAIPPSRATLRFFPHPVAVGSSAAAWGFPSASFAMSVLPSQTPHQPRRILFLRPDAYGDLLLFEPIPRLVRHAWPDTEIGVLIRKPYQDVCALFPSAGVEWLTTDCNPYQQGPGEDLPALEALREDVQNFRPDCVVAACTDQTWLEAAVAAFLPQARQISLGRGLIDPLVRESLEAVLTIDWATIYPERIPVQPEQPEWEKNLRLAGALLGGEAPRWRPVAQVSAAAKARAAELLKESGLALGEYVVCAAAGTANVKIKSWPAEHYGEILAWLEREHAVRALVVGHASEQEHLEAVCRVARAGGAAPALWVGQDGEMPVLGGLLEMARFYLGNDTGAMHLAAALGRPVVPIFGGGTWPRFQPVARRSLTIVQPLPCFGCAWDCFFGDAPCVRTISPGSVRRALERFLSDDADGQAIFEAAGLEAGARALIEKATPGLRFAREDSADRLHQIKELTRRAQTLDRQLQISDGDRNARQSQVEELTLSVQELSVQLAASDADRGARLRQVEELTALLLTSEADRAARLRRMEELSRLLQESEAGRHALSKLLEEQTLRTADTDTNLEAHVRRGSNSAACSEP